MIHTRTKIIASLAFCLFLVALALYLGFFYVINKHKQNLYDERFRAAEAEVQARALSALEETVRSSKEDRDHLAGYILKEEEIIDLLSLIELTAREQGVTFTTTLTTAPIDDVFEELIMNASIEGSFDGVMRMLRILETIPEQSSVPQVNLSKGGGKSLEAWTATVLIHVTKYTKP
jgi:Tfp pilus assembly protein PilO